MAIGFSRARSIAYLPITTTWSNEFAFPCYRFFAFTFWNMPDPIFLAVFVKFDKAQDSSLVSLAKKRKSKEKSFSDIFCWFIYSWILKIRLAHFWSLFGFCYILSGKYPPLLNLKSEKNKIKRETVTAYFLLI